MWRVEYLLSIEGGDRGGMRERELPKAGLSALEPQRDFVAKESNGGLVLRRDLRNRGFDVDDVANSMVYKGRLTAGGLQIFWVPYARYWSHTHPVGYHVYYVPLTLVDELTPEELAAKKREEAAAKQAALEAEKERRETEAREARERKEAEAVEERERREREQKAQAEQRRLADELRLRAMEDKRQQLENARQEADLARVQAEIDRARKDAEAATAAASAPPPPVPEPSVHTTQGPNPSAFRVVEIYGVVGGNKVPFPVALAARRAGDPTAQIPIADTPASGFGLAGDLTTWRRYVPSGDTLGHRSDRGVVAWDGQRPVPLDAATLSQLLPPGWQAVVYGN